MEQTRHKDLSSESSIMRLYVDIEPQNLELTLVALNIGYLDVLEFIQVAGRAGFYTNLQTRPTKLLFTANKLFADHFAKPAG